MVTTDARAAVAFSLSRGHAGGLTEGRKLFKSLGNEGYHDANVIMGKAYERDEERQLFFIYG
jgi:hypothetical protein